MGFLNDLRDAVRNLAQQPPGGFANNSGPSASAQAPRPLALHENVQVILDGSGNGTAKISPTGTRYSGLTWSVDQATVQVTTNVLESQCSLYASYGVSTATPQDLLGQTATGSSGDTNGLGITLRPSDWITAVWSGGDPGAVATLTITGTINPPGT